MGEKETKHYSGILVVTRPNELAECVRKVETVPGVEVHFTYPDSGRIIAVVETSKLEDQQDALRSVQAVPSVLSAELVYYFPDEDPQNAQQPHP